jgi:hypothetical protein
LELVVLLCIAIKEALLSEIKWNVCLERSPYLLSLMKHYSASRFELVTFKTVGGRAAN